jgi:hypothetical protein
VIAPDAKALGVRAEAMIAELAAISAESSRLVRLFLTKTRSARCEAVSVTQNGGC